MKKIQLAGLLSLIIIGTFTSMTAFAGEWKTVTKPTGERWRYENSDGTYALDGWFWLDGNRDGISPTDTHSWAPYQIPQVCLKHLEEEACK